jgi:pyrimidine operon attenuation protein/uracil phosphoribosyltransferase
MNSKLPDAEALLASLTEAMRPRIGADVALVGIHTGGVWLAERLHAALGLKTALGSVDVSFYRDDFGSRGLAGGVRRSTIPFAVDGAHIVIVDDVLNTGRTTRAALNELFDYGRPKRIELAVLVDRGGRELPFSPDYCALTYSLPTGRNLVLERDEGGRLNLRISDE